MDSDHVVHYHVTLVDYVCFLTFFLTDKFMEVPCWNKQVKGKLSCLSDINSSQIP